MEKEEKNEGGIEQMKKRLYSRDTSGIKPRRRRRLRGRAFDVEGKWPGGLPPRERVPPSEKKRSKLTILLIASTVFFIAALSISVVLFLSGSDVSPSNVSIVVQGPATIGGGDELSLQITITNRNAVPIELADLVIEFPSGTRSVSDVSIELSRIRLSLGTISPGGRVQKTVRAVLFGEEQSKKDIAIAVEYRVEGSNAIFFADQTYQLTLSSSPLNLSIQSLKEVISGQDVEFIVTITSNSSNVINDVLLVVEYPFGFEFVEALPAPTFTESVWELGDIEPEGERTITIRGTMVGEDGEERVLRFSSGIQSTKDEKKLAIAFITTLESITIKKPFISVVLALDGNTASEHIAASGRKIRGDITWINNLPIKVTDTVLEVQLKGDALDKRSVSADRGFYRSIDNTLIWSKETHPPLADINPGESGRITFSFASFGLSSGALLRNPEIFLEVNIKGKRISDRDVPEEIESSIIRTVRIASDLLFTPRAVYFTGPFLNNGPMPPQAEKETTYTIIWTIINTTNAISDTSVVATLPSYVRWMNVISPASEKIVFNPIGGKIRWDVGDVAPGSGTIGSQKEVAFQIALLPSISQITEVPILVNEQTASGFDQFTRTKLTKVKSALTTKLSTDPGFRSGGENVVP